MKKKLLIIGGGGREHALGWKLSQSAKIGKLYFAPGNAGTASLGENLQIESEDIESLVEFGRKEQIDLAVVGPEMPLAKGIVDLFKQQEILIFGPTKKAARLESSKAWACKFMRRFNIPHPSFKVFTDKNEAVEFIKSSPWRKVVVKASGLAGGKGVLLPNSQKQAIKAVEIIMTGAKFAAAGKKIVIQERLYGQEISVIAFCDGKRVLPMLAAQDHKPVFDNDCGPNTGGMGAYAPVPFVGSKLLKQVKDTILQRTIDGLAEENSAFVGVLYAGLIITDKGPKVLEFNVRFGDPEAQPQMMLLKSDLLQIMLACIHGTLKKDDVIFKNGYSVCVVLTAGGYPESHKKGEVIYGLDKARKFDIQVFHAGTRKKNKKIVVNGGRVLGVTASASNLARAVKKAYSVIGPKCLHFKDMHYRKDIGAKALN